MDTTKNLNIKQWAEEDRPREKLALKGPSALSNAELLAILIATGTRDESAVDLAMKILAASGNNLNLLGKKSLFDLKKQKGIGEAKAITIMAAMELGRRRRHEDARTITQVMCSRDAFEYLQPRVADLHAEQFWLLCLNRSNAVIDLSHISTGGVASTVVDVKIIMKRCVELLATSIIVCHNHPSGNTKASKEDVAITKKIKEAASFFDITLIDHLIISDNSYLSLADEGLM